MNFSKSFYMLLSGVSTSAAVIFAGLYFTGEPQTDLSALGSEPVQKCSVLSQTNPPLPAADSVRQSLPPSEPPQSSVEHRPQRNREKRKDSEYRSFMIDSKVSSIAKFIELSEDQKKSLREKFKLESLSASERGTAKIKTLEDIIGEEDAHFYREERKRAFEKNRREETEKEVLLLSRKLNLSPEQENQLREIMQDAERKTEEWKKAYEEDRIGLTGSLSDPREKVMLYIQSMRYRDELLRAELKEILSKTQYQLFLKDQASSPTADMVIWHDVDEEGS